MVKQQLRIYLIFFFLVSFSFSGHGQGKIKWAYSYNPDQKTIDIQANIADGWHLYSQYVSNEIGPVPTSFVFQENIQVKLIGKVTEPKPIQKYDENFEAMLDFFEGQVTFSQRVSVKSTTKVEGVVTYMLCNDTMCLPPVEEQFTIEITN
jgi:thiol:disulfide interchange protein DsbD